MNPNFSKPLIEPLFDNLELSHGFGASRPLLLPGDGYYYQFTESLVSATNASLKVIFSGVTNNLIFASGNQTNNDNLILGWQDTNTNGDIFRNDDVTQFPSQLLIDNTPYLQGDLNPDALHAILADGERHTVEMIGYDLSNWPGFFIHDYFNGGFNSAVTYEWFGFDLDGDGSYEFRYDGQGKALASHADMTFTSP